MLAILKQDKKCRGCLNPAPANGFQASHLLDAETGICGNENAGRVSDLVIDEYGRMVVIVIGVDGFLGMADETPSLAGMPYRDQALLIHRKCGLLLRVKLASCTGILKQELNSATTHILRNNCTAGAKVPAVFISNQRKTLARNHCVVPVSASS